jgi:thiosulfate dehydrogenase [quinone] large subunit
VVATGSGAVQLQIERLDDSRIGRPLIAVVRIGVAFLWIQNLGWKVPPSFGEGSTPPEGLYQFTRYAVDYPVFTPYANFVDHVVLPNFVAFAWLTLLLEACIGAFLLIGLAVRFWALVGAAQSLVITLSVLNAPNEWHWAYYLMILSHLALFAVAAGRAGGLDGALRPVWRQSTGRLARTLLTVS